MTNAAWELDAETGAPQWRWGPTEGEILRPRLSVAASAALEQIIRDADRMHEIAAGLMSTLAAVRSEYETVTHSHPDDEIRRAVLYMSEQEILRAREEMGMADPISR